MSFQTFALISAGLVLIQGLVAIVLSHGLNGKYFRQTPHMAEAIRNLRRDKPKTATVIGSLYALSLFEVALVFVAKNWS
jgi:hypothetical protein